MSAAPPVDFRLDHLRQILGDRYQFEAFLGRGAFASVYLVKNLRLGRSEALKVLGETHDMDGEFGQRFVEEAMLVASLDHPNIVKVYDYGQNDGIIWYSMQLIDGPTLRAELTARKRMNPSRVAHLAVPLLDALEYSHHQGIVHRDVKPSNILLDSRGRPYIMDFGIAKSTESALKTMTGSILGTPAYISPEQMGGGEVDGRADMYSLGIALYELIAGLPPFHGPEPLVVMMQRLEDDAESLQVRFPEVDAELDAIILKSIARKPDNRFANAAEMRQELIDRFGVAKNEQQYPVQASAPEQQQLTQIVQQSATDQPRPAPMTVPMADLNLAPKVEPTIASATNDADSRQRRPSSAPWSIAVVIVILILGFGWLWTRLEQDPPTTPLQQSTSSTQPPAEPTATELVERKESPSAAEAPPLSPPPPEPQPTLPPPPPPPEPPPTVAQPAPQVASPPIIRRPVKMARILETPLNELPTEDAAGCEGTSAVVSIQVGEDGRATRARVLKADQEHCKTAAETLARNSLFAPAEDIDGQPIASTITISLNLTFDKVKP